MEASDRSDIETMDLGPDREPSPGKLGGEILRPGDEMTIEDRPFFVVRRLGRGGMGEAYLVRHASGGLTGDIDRVVKVAFPTDKAQQAFGDELAVLMAGQEEPHPNLMTLAGHGTLVREDLQYPYMALERLFPLDRLASFDPGTALTIFHDLLDGLIHLHTELGFVHNDVKLANLALRFSVPRIDPDDDHDETWRRAAAQALSTGAWRAVLLDYGSVTRVGEDADKIQITPDHAAPDYFTEHDTWRKRDGYAAALVLFQMITGRRPFGDRTDVEEVIEALHEQERPIEPDAVLEARFHEPLHRIDRTELLEGIRDLVRLGTEPDPERRKTPFVLRDELHERFSFEKRTVVIEEEREKRIFFEGVELDPERNRYRSQLKHASSPGMRGTTTTGTSSTTGRERGKDTPGDAGSTEAPSRRTRGWTVLVCTVIAAGAVFGYQYERSLRIRWHDLALGYGSAVGLSPEDHARALATLGAPAVRYVVAELEEARGAGDDARAEQLLGVLSRCRVPEAVEPLAEFAPRAEDPTVRARAIRGLGLHADLRTAELVYRSFRDDPSGLVREAARRAMAPILSADRGVRREAGEAVYDAPIPDVPTTHMIESWWDERADDLPEQIGTFPAPREPPSGGEPERDAR